MSVYKVLQDIEGEDHIIAWLTPRQTIYAAIVVVSMGLAFLMSRISILLAVPWIIPIGFFGFLAAPLGRDQPNDIWLGAQIRFYLKNRVRVWDQSGMQELVHITVPKRVERIYTNGLNQREVRSRLSALSTTIDSRGWAVKNSNVNLANTPQFIEQFTNQTNDRLLGGNSLQQDVPISDVTAADDIMDEANNSVAQRFDQQIKQQEINRINQLRKAAQNGTLSILSPPQQAASTTTAPPQPPQDFYFMQQQAAQQAQGATTQPLATFSAQVVAPGAQITDTATDTATDVSAQALLDKIHHDQEIAHDISEHSHEKIIKTAADIAEEQHLIALQEAEQKRIAAEAERQRIAKMELVQKTAQHTASDAILKELSQSDLKISTLASQAKHASNASSDGEVVISLH
jgi:hypothetical protein